MLSYPILTPNREEWQKKISSTSMFTIPAQDQALPNLHQFSQLLTNLLTKPIHCSLSEQAIPFFFLQAFPTVCHNLIKSRYFKSSEVLALSNSILYKSVMLVASNFQYAVKNPSFLKILMMVFCDQCYFKTNNQVSYMVYPYGYFNGISASTLRIVGEIAGKDKEKEKEKEKERKDKIKEFKVGDQIDVVKVGNLYQKITWSQGQIVKINQAENQYQVSYKYDGHDKTLIVKRDSQQIAPLGTKSITFQWRKNLKKGDLVDVQDTFGSWYNGTVLQIIQRQNGRKNIKITLKIYNQNGNKQDENGLYFGFADRQQTVDFTSAKIAPYCTVAKQFCYQSNKISSYDVVDDLNDYQFQEINGKKIYALPRKKNLSEFQFHTLNAFGELGGFDAFLGYLEKQVNIQLFCLYVKAVSGVTPYIHRQVVKTLVQKTKKILQSYLFPIPSPPSPKLLSKQLSQMLFAGLKTLQKRLYPSQAVTKYQNTIKIKLVSIYLQSQTLKIKLQGLSQLKDIVRSVTYSSQKNRYIRQWVKADGIFEKIYISNSHVQLIKKSEEFFKYLINQSILEVTDLEKIYRIAQKGDFESRVSIYKLFQEVCHIFKKEHVQFLIDKILESELHLILNQDIDLLHQLSRFSNYFPLQKVFAFFENIILGDNKAKQLNDYATKKYSEIISKNQQVKPQRRQIIKTLFQKLYTHDITKIAKILKGIFQGFGSGQWGKKDLNQLLSQQKVDQILVSVLKSSKSKNDPNFSKNLTTILDLLLFIYKLSYRTKISLKILVEIQQLVSSPLPNSQLDALNAQEVNALALPAEQKNNFYRWLNQIYKCEQGIDIESNQQLQIFFRKLFTQDLIPDMNASLFQLARNLFGEVNKREKNVVVFSVYKDREMQKQYKRKVEMKGLKLYDVLLQMVYNIKSETVNEQALNFFIQLYTSKQNTQQQIDEFLEILISDFKSSYSQSNNKKLSHTIKLLQIIINDSQKSTQTSIKSLISKKQPEIAKFTIMNDISYQTKKSQLTIPMNTSLLQLRKELASKFLVSWPQVSITAHKVFPHFLNSLTLKQLSLSPNQPLTITKITQSPQIEQQLLIPVQSPSSTQPQPQVQMNPKAVKCFQKIFSLYSTNGLMDHPQCSAFTSKCLGTNCTTKYYQQKISSLYKKYDDDEDGFLTFDNFLQFYLDAAKDRPSTVWLNLRSFGVRGDFRFAGQEEGLQRYPREVIGNDKQVYEILFEGLRNRAVAKEAFFLLQRLPVSKAIQGQLLEVKDRADLERILDCEDLYRLYYRMNIIQYLCHSTQLESQLEKQWHQKFIEMNGYQLLYQCLLKISDYHQDQKNKDEQLNNVLREIYETILNLLNQYWIQCFSKDSKQLRISLAFISSDQQIDDKMDYLLLDKFPKSQKRIQPIKSKLPSSCYTWKSTQKRQIQNFFISQLTKKWQQYPKTQSSSPSSSCSQKKYSLSVQISKIMDTLNIIFMNENPQKLVSTMTVIFQENCSQQLIRRYYCLIISLCFYASQDKYQGAFIKELFKNLTKPSITSEHFRVLSVLVTKFGIKKFGDQTQESEESIQKLKQVLFDNILKNNNQLTVQGCAKLLTNFNLQSTPFSTFSTIWSLLFSPSTPCQKQSSRQCLFTLILHLASSNPLQVPQILSTILQTLQSSAPNLKITSSSQFKQRSGTGYAGLKNLGNTCYINSMMQQIFMNCNFRYCVLRAEDGQGENFVTVGEKGEKLQKGEEGKGIGRVCDDNFLHQVQRIFGFLELTNRIDYAPRDFCIAYKPFGQSVNVMIQQDVQQFISMFFDRLEARLSRTVFKKLVQNYYTGKTVNLFKCLSCQKTKKVEQSFHSISLQVKTSKTLSQSFNRFCHGQMINDYKCDFCNNKVDVSKKTRISVSPKILIIHLQRIVFNLDTFINQKITSKHSFPHSFNLHTSTLDYYQKNESPSQPSTQSQSPTEPLPMDPPSQNYTLCGIVCHSGTAQSGHYISYIKTKQNKWIQFNDSQVLTFNPSNIESQCFGGNWSMSTGMGGMDDDFYQEKKEASKSAYLLIYQRDGEENVELDVGQTKGETRGMLLERLDLRVVQSKNKDKIGNDNGENSNLSASKNSENENATNYMTQQKQQSSSAPEDSQKQTKKLLEEKQLQIKRHQSEDNIETQLPIRQKGQQVEKGEKQLQKQSQKPQSKQQIQLIQTPVNPYIPSKLRDEIVKDNEVHFYEKCLSSPSFIKFFSTLVAKCQSSESASLAQLLPVYQKLTFTFWLKSPCFKDLLSTLNTLLQTNPQSFSFSTLITNNPLIPSLLIESSDSQIRTAMANFLAQAIGDFVQGRGIRLNKKVKDNQNSNQAQKEKQGQNNKDDDGIFQFLDKLLGMLGGTVSKCWTKFGQYFQFWYQLSKKGAGIVQYMIDREVIKYFMDYFLDGKSPLKIYASKKQHQIGSSYANPNFSMLLKCVSSLLEQKIQLSHQSPTQMPFTNPDEQLLLMSFQSLQKLISDNYQSIAAKLVQQICPHNLPSSQKAAIVLLKGINKSNTDSIQPYLEVLHEFVLIADQYQDKRIGWVIGRQTLAVSTLSMKIVAINSFSLEERIYNFQSAFQVQSGCALLQPILAFCKRIETFAMLCTREVLRLCDQSQKIRKYIFTLESPTLVYSKYTDFFKGFIDKYLQDQKKSYGFYSSSSGFNKEQFAKQVKQLYQKVMKKVKQQGLDGPIPWQQQYEIGQIKPQVKPNPQPESEPVPPPISTPQQKTQQTVGNQTSCSTQISAKQKQKQKQKEKQKAASQKKVAGKQKVTIKKNYDFKITKVHDYSGYDAYDEDDDWGNFQVDSLPENLPRSSDKGRVGKEGRNKYGVMEENQIDQYPSLLDRNTSNEENHSDSQQTSELLSKKTEPQPQSPYPATYHPIKFTYTQIASSPQLDSLALPPNISIEQHDSPVVYLLTQPTGVSNSTFPPYSNAPSSTSSSHSHPKSTILKTSQRLLASAWQTARTKNVHGYLVKNYGKETVRVQTDQGAMGVRGGENLFIWAKKILRVWETQRGMDWPKWVVYPRQGNL